MGGPHQRIPEIVGREVITMKQLQNAADTSIALVSDEDIEGCRNSLLWSLRAVGTAVGFLGIEDEEFQQMVVEDEDYFLMVLQLLKMLAVDQKYAENLAEVRERVVRKIALAVAVRNDSDTEALIAADIDFDQLPPMPDFPGEMIDGLRPGVLIRH